MKRRTLAALALAASGLACSRGDAARAGAAPAQRGPLPFDWERPAASLRMGPDEVAARIGSFDWTGTASWSVTRGEKHVDAAEQHRVRQLATGEFAAEGTVDPGRGPGSESGKRVVFTKGTTYARSLYPASGAWRERPDDHGRGARRFRDESFLLAAAVADLLGPARVVTPAGTATALGRPARRFVLSLDASRFAPGPSALSPNPPPGGPDADTRLRLMLLDGRQPIDASGELVADAATGAPLAIRLRALLGVKDDPEARVRVEIEGRLTALGGEVTAVEAPQRALPDERRPKGVARALEQAGLKKRKGPGGTAPEGAPEGAPDSDEPDDEE